MIINKPIAIFRVLFTENDSNSFETITAKRNDIALPYMSAHIYTVKLGKIL